MPIDKAEYHPKWSLISRLIIHHRAKNHCETCGVKNAEIIQRGLDGDYRYATSDELHLFEQRRKSGIYYWTALKEQGLTRVILTTAHLDRNRSNNAFSNLKALCQRCHFAHDRAANIAARLYGKRDKTLPIF